MADAQALGGSATGWPSVSEATPRREQEDAYRAEFEATAIRSEERDGKPWVLLAESWFYPESGGQLADRGSIGAARVDDVQQDAHGRVWHRTDRDPGTGGCSARIDWSRRFDHMQQHTGQHVLSAAFEREAKAPTLSSTLGAERSVIEVGLAEADWRLVERIERAANQVVWEDRVLEQHWTDREHVGRFALRKPPQIDGRIRIIEIPDWDLSACGGTHTRRTGEVGAIKVVGWERVRGNLRFSFQCGRRALEDHAWRTEAMIESARRRTLRDRELIAHLERACEERDLLRKRLTELERLAMAQEARRLVGDAALGVAVLAEERSRDDARQFALLALEAGAPWVVSGTLAPEPSLVVVAAPKPGSDLRSMLPELLARARGKGGGSPVLLTIAPADAEAAREAHALAVQRLTAV